MRARVKTDGLDRTHIKGPPRAVVACTSAWYIKGDCKFGRVGLPGRGLVGYSVRNFAGRRAKNYAIH